MCLRILLAAIGLTALTASTAAEKSPVTRQSPAEIRAFAREALTRFDRLTPGPPSCGSGWAESPAGYVVAVAAWAEQAGLFRGDQIVAVGGASLEGLDQRLRAYRQVSAGGPFLLGVIRQGKARTLTLPCRHQPELFRAERRTLETASRGDWDGCIAAAKEARQLAGFNAYVILIREHACMGAKNPSIASPEGRAFASLHYELTQTLLRESRYVPGGTANVRERVRQMADELRRLGSPEQAGALEAELQATLAALPRLELTWRDNATNKDGFLVERKIGKNGRYLRLVTLSPNTTAYVDTSVQEGVTYCYRVKAFTGSNYSDPTDEACGVAHLPSSPGGGAGERVGDGRH